ncbi:hypothetical protein ACQEVM_34210 [Streptomyces sp. CA-243310]|uniref:hypothetical protein n=1 Tax=Streptomyces sp. CA-243310 TaxID=3240056 RepID=UPI003D918E84
MRAATCPEWTLSDLVRHPVGRGAHLRCSAHRGRPAVAAGRRGSRIVNGVNAVNDPPLGGIA